MYAETVVAAMSRVRAGVHGPAFSPVGVLRILDQADDDGAGNDPDLFGDAGGLAIFCRDAQVWDGLAALCAHVRDQLGAAASPVRQLPSITARSSELGAA